MISLIEALPPRHTNLAADVRLYSLFDAYGKSGLALFWQQQMGDRVTALVSKMDGAITLCAYEGADLTEIEQFISVVGAESVLSNLPLSLKGEKILHQLTCKGGDGPLPPSLDCQSAYNIMSTGFDMPPFQVWYPDMSHRIRHGTAHLFGDEAAVLCGFMAGESMLIVGVCSLPDFKGQGRGARLIDSLTASNGAKNYILLAEESLKQYYVNLGFAPAGYHYLYGDV